MAILDSIRDAMMRARQQVKPPSISPLSPIVSPVERQMTPRQLRGRNRNPANIRRPNPGTTTEQLIFVDPNIRLPFENIPPRKEFLQPPRLPSIEQMPRLDAVDDRGVPIFGGKDMFTGPMIPPSTMPQPGLPEGIDPGGQYYTDPITGNQMYQPPMPSAPPGMMIPQVMPRPIDLTTGQPLDTSIPLQQPMMPPIPRTDGMIDDLPRDVDPTSLTVSPPAETTLPPDTAPVTTETAPATGSVAQAPGPYAAGVKQVATKLDPLTEQLLFGIGGKGGFIPGAMRASEKVFYDDQGQPIVIDERVADFSPDQLAAMQMQRESLGMQDPYLQQAAGAYGAGTQALEEGLQRGRTAAIGALEATRGGVGSLQQGLGESADILRGTIGGYDPSMTDRFYDPYEDRVVQQTISDIMERGAQGDIAARAGDIARGGESAFGSRARLGASERQEALGRGLAEAVSGIRSRGFSEAQRTGLGEFARQKGAERAASAGLAGLAGQGFGGSQALAGALSGLGGTEQQIGQQRYSGQFGLGSSLQGLGAQAAGASASDIAALYGMGTQQQGQAQRMLDAQRRNLQQRQMTPLLQYQALQPFVSMAPAGQFQTITDFAPKPSAMQIGIGTGLSTFGALGNLYGGGS
jgi:hypothetical protein